MMPLAAIATSLLMNLINGAPDQAPSQAAPPSFEVASIKANHSADRMVSLGNSPGGRFNAKNVSLKMLMRMAYKVQDFQISGGPAWINSERYDIEAKPESSGGSEGYDMRKLSDNDREAQMEQQRLRLQALLADRFKLTVHRETKELPVYALVIAKNGPKLKEAAVAQVSSEPPGPPGAKGPRLKGRGVFFGRGQLSGQAAPISILAETLSNAVGRQVIDRTDLKGVYDFTLQWTPDESQQQMFKGPGDGGDGRGPGDGAPPADSSGPSVFTAIQEQLGLKLEPQKGPVQILVIDGVERPTEN